MEQEDAGKILSGDETEEMHAHGSQIAAHEHAIVRAAI
jgi:hypothetical protein